MADNSTLLNMLSERAEDQQSPSDLGYTLGATERVELDGRKKFFELRSMWSKWIIAWITSFFIFHISLTVGIGIKWFDFTSHQWMVPMIVGENFLQVIGMGYIIVRFLYPGTPQAK